MEVALKRKDLVPMEGKKPKNRMSEIYDFTLRNYISLVHVTVHFLINLPLFCHRVLPLSLDLVIIFDLQLT